MSPPHCTGLIRWLVNTSRPPQDGYTGCNLKSLSESSMATCIIADVALRARNRSMKCLRSCRLKMTGTKSAAMTVQACPHGRIVVRRGFHATFFQHKYSVHHILKAKHRVCLVRSRGGLCKTFAQTAPDVDDEATSTSDRASMVSLLN